MASEPDGVLLRVDGVTVAFDGHVVLDGIDLSLADGEIVGLLGPSGSGKSTLLRIIAGIQQPDAGRVELDGGDVTGLPTHQRSVGIVFQDEQLFPHLDVGENIGFGLRMRGVARAERRRAVDHWLRLVALDGFADRSVDHLSGGEAKRVAVARSLAAEPAVLLLDEPLTGLDEELRERLAVDLADVIRTSGTTAIWVTHDPSEARAVGDRHVRLSDLARRTQD